MSEIRTPHLTILLRFQGKNKATKVELFKAEQWKAENKNQYRIRVKGKWWPNDKMQFYYKTTFMQILSKSIEL